MSGDADRAQTRENNSILIDVSGFRARRPRQAGTWCTDGPWRACDGKMATRDTVHASALARKPCSLVITNGLTRGNPR